jgi:hypothetical protein
VSVEHVIPESLGNTTMTLPVGIVCDPCNNYFARKVEQPFLSSPPVLALRAFQRVSNKRGRIPALDVLGPDGLQGQIHHVRGGPMPVLALDAGRDAFARLFGGRPRASLALVAPEALTPDRMVARFVAKAALESLAHRNRGHPVGLAALVGATHVEGLRRSARYGDGPDWPVRITRIHEPDHLFVDSLPDGQRVWECNLQLVDDHNLIYAVSIFGLEFVINLVQRDLSQCDRWLHETGTTTLLSPQGLPADRIVFRTAQDRERSTHLVRQRNVGHELTCRPP